MNFFTRALQFLRGTKGRSPSRRVLHVLIGSSEGWHAPLYAEGWEVLRMDTAFSDGKEQGDGYSSFLKAAIRRQGPVLVEAAIRSCHLRPEGLTHFEEAASEAGFGRVELLLLTRDPGARIRSRRSDMLMEPERGFVAYEDMLGDVDDPVHALAWHEAACRSRCTQLVVRNADRCGERLPGILEAWLGLPSGVLKAALLSAGRRDLTSAEIVFLESIQRHARYPLPPIAVALTDVEPLDAQAELPLESTFREALRARIGSAMETFHANAEPDARFAWDIPDSSIPESRFRYSPRQIEVIAEVYGRHIEAMRKEQAEVVARFNDWLNA